MVATVSQHSGQKLEGMYDDDGLFGRDMRHKPPPQPQLTSGPGWGNSRGRLAYSFMNRHQEENYSEYAVTMLGFVPEGYVIVNEGEVEYDPETALKVCHGRVAIPVKELARQRDLTLSEQWELMNPRWVGTYFDCELEGLYRNRRPNFRKAVVKAIGEGRYDEFRDQFWCFELNFKAVRDMQLKLKELKRIESMVLEQKMKLELKISHMENDMRFGNLNEYHLQGLNAHEQLEILKEEFSEKEIELQGVRVKIWEIEEYIKERTFY